jgi:hypothetical protein
LACHVDAETVKDLIYILPPGPARNRLIQYLAEITIDGSNVSGITIDGETVQEVTMDGTVVWTAIESGTETFEHGSIHMNDLDFVSDWSGNTGYISNTTNSISGSRSLHMEVANTGNKSVTCSFGFRHQVFEWKWNCIVYSTGSLGDNFSIRLQDAGGAAIAGVHTEIDDTPEGDDQVVQPRVNGNDSYELFLSENTTYTMKMVFDWSASNFDFYVDGSLEFSDIGWWGSPSDFSSTQIRMSGDADGNDWEMWVDDIYIEEYSA